MTLRLGDLIKGAFRAFDPAATKVHLAQSNGQEHPIDVLQAGHFDVWQSNQSKMNFSREFLVSLVQTAVPDRWLFAGLWRITGAPVWGPETYAPLVGKTLPPCWIYPTEPVAELTDYAKRLTIAFRKPFRIAYPNWETCGDDLIVASLTEDPIDAPTFPGYRDVRITMPLLRRLIATAASDWQVALSAVGGVYLLTDGEGRQYVGSATGDGGFWARWSDYAATGHGGNKGLVGLNDKAFTFAVLETADTRTGRDDILRREAHWKAVLGSRAFGLNHN